MSLELSLLKNLIYNEDYTRKVFPYIKEEYFSENKDKLLFRLIHDFVNKYKVSPTHESLIIDLSNTTGISDADLKGALNTLNEIEEIKHESSDLNWLIDQTEKFIQDRAIYLAIMESVSILDESNKHSKGKGEIPNLLSDALAVSLDNNIGHDFTENYEERYDFYHAAEKRVPTDLDLLNKILNGGFPVKSLSLFMSNTTGGGKSLLKCHLSAAALLQGYNVLYITMEMPEEKIAERIDANLLNMKIQDLHQLTKDEYIRKFKNLRNKVTGKLIIKEYPGTASVNHFRSLLNELNLKRNFVPDIIFIDYLNICSSSRIRMGGSTNSYGYVKAIAEEIRGLAMEFNIPIVSSNQATRGASNSSDVDLTNVADSIGISYTVDFMAAIISSEELDGLGQIMIKQLKNRWNSLDYYKRFVLGVDKAKMKIFNIESSSQENIADAGYSDDEPINSFGVKRTKNKFEGFKV